MTTPAPASERTAMLDRLSAQIVTQTARFARGTEVDSWANVPIDTDVMFLGTRINRITIGALLRHLGTAETHWLGRLAEAEDGEDLGIPTNGASLNDVADGEDLLDALDAAYQKNRAILRSLTATDLDKQVTCGSYRYTVEAVTAGRPAHGRAINHIRNALTSRSPQTESNPR